MEICRLIFYSFIASIITWGIIEWIIKWYIKREVKNYTINSLREVTCLAWFAGFLEIFLYTVSIIIKKPEFIAVWIGLKTAIKWNRSQNRKSLSETELRGNYLTQLIGNSLNIIFAIVMVYIIKGECFFYNY
jgi:hypothetical protein